jgi:hypothetical protein
VIDDATYDLPIAATLPDNYLAPFLEKKETKELHFRSSGETSFKVRVKLISSVFTQDPSLNEFFRLMPEAMAPALAAGGGGAENKQVLSMAVDGLPHASPLSCVKWMPFLLNYILKGIATRPSAGEQLWEALNYVVHRYVFLCRVVLLFAACPFVFESDSYLCVLWRISVSSYFKEINRCGLVVAYVNHKYAYLLPSHIFLFLLLHCSELIRRLPFPLCPSQIRQHTGCAASVRPALQTAAVGSAEARRQTGRQKGPEGAATRPKSDRICLVLARTHVQEYGAGARGNR